MPSNPAKKRLESRLDSLHKSRLAPWLGISLLVHAAIIGAIFLHLDSLGFKKGTSQNRAHKVAGFSIIGGATNSIESIQSAKASQQGKNQPKKENNDSKSSLEHQSIQSFDMASLSLAPSNSSGRKNSKASKNARMLDHFPGISEVTRRDIEALYGEEFGDYGLAEQEFLVNNLRHIGRITQSYLRYPRVAAQLGQEGVSAVEFYLHPNGDISELKLIVSSSFMLLDRNSARTIEIAYKDYPRPTTKTKIRIFVSYGLLYY